ncbi:hypothetical protein JH06_2160 [Blastocystis sp. subtype 4]|uniref:hypothetical protein n=1 Tax=Blastocystis sp. subtype 4 TaxID=944170 RepID=UPI00071153B9|nr:hypothetical protein JH06_2160 [Blastocystis sp. subtype 4]KNB43879.1 hypothetical protein JH06_2160 [Blastocystis sp. subtype 4]|eukprot:XP_014527322.1 hypothetical protein JH06_2160 [Blastocystis sp. subtype 4]
MISFIKTVISFVCFLILSLFLLKCKNDLALHNKLRWNSNPVVLDTNPTTEIVTEKPRSSLYDITFVSQATLNRWDFMIQIASYWKGFVQ